MLKFINIINLAVIERLTVELKEGLCLLTGETGAGKSIIVDALGFLLGRRGGGELVRTGERLAVIEGGFELYGEALESAEEFLDGLGLANRADEEILIRREIGATGQGRIFINDRRVTNATLRQLQPHLLEILGQGEHFLLTSRHSHLDMLDNFAGCEEVLRETAKAHGSWRSAEETLSELRRKGAEREQRVDYLRFQLSEIERVNPQPGEEAQLLSEKSLLANVERIFELCSASYEGLYESDESVQAKLGAVRRRLVELAHIDRRAEPLQSMFESASAMLDEVAAGLRSLGQGINFSEGRLVEIENRLAEIQRLKRKYGREFEALLELRGEIGAELAQLESREQSEELLRQRAAEARREYLSLALTLSRKRLEAVPAFERRLSLELRQLALENAKFEVQFETFFAPGRSVDGAQGSDAAETAALDSTERLLSQTGADRVVFMFSANRGEEARPLDRVASGGELSRLMLALRTVGLKGPKGASTGRTGVTLIFDEIDAGIGGKTAEAVGLRLRQLSERRQVLCVTHQPQIARFAEHHYVVSKGLEHGRTVTRVRELEGFEERVGELARMIGGAEDIEAARATAKWMLEERPAPTGRRGRRAV